MKNKILIASILSASMFTLHANAQLTVAASGNVGIGLASDTITPLSLLSVGSNGFSNATVSVVSPENFTSTTNWNNIYSKYTVISGASNPQWNVAIHGETGASTAGDRLVGVRGNAIKSSQVSTGRTYGVVGIAGNATSGYNYGTCGFPLYGTTSYGAGIYGDINSFTEVSVPGRYAGYFNGQTRVNGDFYANSVNTTSDARLKSNIKKVDPEILGRFQDLRPIQFTWNPAERPNISDTTSVNRTYLSEDTDYKRLHYGFLAQDIQSIFPDLVREDGDGYLSVNYIELIPLLVKAVQELSAEVEDLKDAATKQTDQ